MELAMRAAGRMVSIMAEANFYGLMDPTMRGSMTLALRKEKGSIDIARESSIKEDGRMANKEVKGHYIPLMGLSLSKASGIMGLISAED